MRKDILIMDRNAKRRCISIILFAVYMCVLVYFLFFAESMGRSFAARSYHYNLTPLKEIKRFIVYARILGPKAVWLNLAGNVAAFVPFGIFIIPVSGRRFGMAEAVVLSADFSIFVEVIQLLTKVGSFDVDDIILNTAGGLIGVLLYKLFIRIEGKKRDGGAQI